MSIMFLIPKYALWKLCKTKILHLILEITDVYQNVIEFVVSV